MKMKTHTPARTQRFQCLSRLEDIVVSVVVEVVFRRTFKRKIEGDAEYYYIVHLLLVFFHFLLFTFILDISTRKYRVYWLLLWLLRYSPLDTVRTVPAFFTFTIFIFMTFGIGEFIGTQFFLFNGLVWVIPFLFPCLLFIRLWWKR